VLKKMPSGKNVGIFLNSTDTKVQSKIFVQQSQLCVIKKPGKKKFVKKFLEN